LIKFGILKFFQSLVFLFPLVSSYYPRTMLFYETYSHEHPSPHDDVCTISRNLAAHLFCNTHPHVARNKHQSRNVSWKKNFQTNWHIHAAIFEQSLRKIMEMNNVDISVDDSDLAFCIREHREYFEACFNLVLNRNLRIEDYKALKPLVDIKYERAQVDNAVGDDNHDNMLYSLQNIPSKNRLRVLSRREASAFE
tara:strand:+ start:33549 stop:34133 length:585 start_codon:yes stop_codon:yes gene_type:complete